MNETVITILGVNDFDDADGRIIFPPLLAQPRMVVVITDIAYWQATGALTSFDLQLRAEAPGAATARKQLALDTTGNLRTYTDYCRRIVPWETDIFNWDLVLNTTGKTVDGTLSVTWFYSLAGAVGL